MARAVNCAADRPAARWRSVRAASDSAPFGMPIDNEFLTDEFCRVLGFQSAAVEFARPVTAPIPILLVTGTLDATNPVENAVEIARHLPGATLLEVENAAHESLPVPAVQDVVVAFFQGAPVRAERIRVTPPRYPGIEAAAASRR
jgi:pimeloyl-ACP methyl ester carboxylesterase